MYEKNQRNQAKACESVHVPTAILPQAPPTTILGFPSHLKASWSTRAAMSEDALCTPRVGMAKPQVTQDTCCWCFQECSSEVARPSQPYEWLCLDGPDAEYYVPICRCCIHSEWRMYDKELGRCWHEADVWKQARADFKKDVLKEVRRKNSVPECQPLMFWEDWREARKEQ